MTRFPRVRTRWFAAGLLALLGLLLAWRLLPRREIAPAGPIHFRDATAESGVAFVHTDGSSGQRYIVETVTAGLATFDSNGDGWIVLYFLNGAPLRGTALGKPRADAAAE
jgi:hypothetical protein